MDPKPWPELQRMAAAAEPGSLEFYQLNLRIAELQRQMAEATGDDRLAEEARQREQEARRLLEQRREMAVELMMRDSDGMTREEAQALVEQQMRENDEAMDRYLRESDLDQVQRDEYRANAMSRRAILYEEAIVGSGENANRYNRSATVDVEETTEDLAAIVLASTQGTAPAFPVAEVTAGDPPPVPAFPGTLTTAEVTSADAGTPQGEAETPSIEVAEVTEQPEAPPPFPGSVPSTSHTLS